METVLYLCTVCQHGCLAIGFDLLSDLAHLTPVEATSRLSLLESSIHPSGSAIPSLSQVNEKDLQLTPIADVDTRQPFEA